MGTGLTDPRKNMFLHDVAPCPFAQLKGEGVGFTLVHANIMHVQVGPSYPYSP